MADETHHRDVNHTFADLQFDDPNPYVLEHKENAAIAWRLELTGQTSTVGMKASKTSPTAVTADAATATTTTSATTPVTSK
jgi:hypothetical protein